MKTPRGIDAYQEAMFIYEKVAQLVSDVPIDNGSHDSFIRSSVACGVYEHFKSTPESRKYYAVTGVARMVNRHQGVLEFYDYHVVYQSLYPPHTNVLVTRELIGPDGFIMPVDRQLERGHYRGDRFRLVRSCSLIQLHELSRAYSTR